MLLADNSVRIDKICQGASPKQIFTISMHLSNLVKIHWDFYSSYCPESKIWMYCGQITMSKFDKLCPLEIPKQMSTISMHIPSLVKIFWYLLKLLYRNQNTDVPQADNSVKSWLNLPINNSKPDLHNSNAHTEFGENPLTFTQVNLSSGHENKEGRMTDGQTHGQRDIIVPSHYPEVGYKNRRNCFEMFSGKIYLKQVKG